MGRSDRFQHIEGLRGVAILSILLFHAYPGVFETGYFGVEVFLVVSGYLLFRKPMVVEGVSLGVACRDFVQKKAVRLIFPLSALVLSTLAAAPFLLAPQYCTDAVQTAVYALLGVANHHLGAAAQGYFAMETGNNPLMHTWYLSVLLQVFALYLVGNVLLHRVPRKGILGFLWAVGLLSLLCHQWPVVTKIYGFVCGGWLPESPFGYYSTTPRLWAVLAGGAAHLLPAPAGKPVEKWLATAGLVLIILLSSYTPLGTDFAPVLVVAATVLFLRYGAVGLGAWLAGVKPLGWLGKVSFSLYLVHMPLLAIYRSAPRGGVAGDILLMAAMLPVAWVFYKAVEVRKPRVVCTLSLWGGALAAAACMWAALPACFLWEKAYPHYTPYTAWREPAIDAARGLDTALLPPSNITKRMAGADDCPAASLFAIGADGGPSFVLIGDSHASAFYYGLDSACRQAGLSGLFLNSYIVPFYGWYVQGSDRAASTSSERLDALFAWLEAHPEIRTVIICQRWYRRYEQQPDDLVPGPGAPDSKDDALRLFLLKLKDMGRQALVSTPAPETVQPPTGLRLQPCKLQETVCTAEDYLAQAECYFTLLEGLEAEGLCKILHVEQAFFAGGGALHAAEDGEYLMWDRSHFSPAGAERAARGCLPDIRGCE